MPRHAPNLITGTVKRTSSGVGYLIPQATPGQPPTSDIFLSRSDLADAHTGDEVLVQILGRGGPGGKLRGRVVEVVSRATRTFVGTYFEDGSQGFVRVDGTTLGDPIRVGDPGAKGARPGDKVVLEMVRFPSHARPGEGVLTRVLGAAGDPGVDTLSIIHEFNLPDEFPEDVLADARAQADRFHEDDLTDRLDLTAETIVTIDPVDARDFDDAISLSRDPQSAHWNLGVHIADVAWFVPAGGLLDREAYRRGTSVYLPDRVLPMLPEVISNALASLQQGQLRYTQSVLIEFSPDGVPLSTRFSRSAIRVTERFAYEQVMPIINHPGQHAKTVAPPVRDLLARMFDLAMLLRNRRFASGALELQLPEVKIDLGRDGKMTGAHVAPHDASHQIIEEFMLAANCAVAQALSDAGLPFLRRVHNDPDELKMRAFGKFVTALGFKLKKYQSRPDIQHLLNNVQSTKYQHAVNYALLRSLKQAEYSPEQLGHYALAVDNYCHFTSPIRRYPDLMVHRLLDRLTRTRSPVEIDPSAAPNATRSTRRKTPGPRSHSRAATDPRPSRRNDPQPAPALPPGPFPGPLQLTVAGRHCSVTERRAEQAERELIRVKLLTFLSSQIGLELDAFITGVQDYGFFCQGIDIPAEGLVHVVTLGDEFFDFEAQAQRLIARQSGRSYQLGDRLRVQVARVDIDRRQLDFRLPKPRRKK